MAVQRDLDWDADRRQFVDQFRAGSSERTGARRLADQRAQIWSPLARQFADLGRDVFPESRLSGVVRRVLAVAVRAMPAAELAVLTMRRPGEAPRTSGFLDRRTHTGRRAEEVDEAQISSGRGPFHDATRRTGPGTAESADLTAEPAWPEFAARAVEDGLCSVRCAGVFPPGGGAHGALAVYSAQPSGFAGTNPDQVVVLGACVAAALGTARGVSPEELERTPVVAPVRSSLAVERAVAVLTDQRGMGVDEAYDVLRKASQEINATRRP